MSDEWMPSPWPSTPAGDGQIMVWRGGRWVWEDPPTDDAALVTRLEALVEKARAQLEADFAGTGVDVDLARDRNGRFILLDAYSNLALLKGSLR